MKPLLSRLTLGIVVALYGIGASATESEFDFSFLQGGAKIDPSVLENISSRYIPGRYLLDVSLNDRAIGKRIVTVTDEDKDKLCLSEAWFNEAGFGINSDFYTPYYNQKRQCFVIEDEPNTEIDFDFSTQSISFKIPQKGLAKRNFEHKKWDYGISAIRMNYNANISVNDVSTTAYSSIGVKANVGRWIASTSVGISDSSIDVPMITATRALRGIKADLTVGKTSVGGSLVGGASVLGVGLVSNSSMQANDIGYRPVFSGIASSHARVTLSQNGSIVYSEMVPPGPFEIDDVNLLSSGDVTMTVTEQDGSVNTQIIPLTIVPNMLNAGESEYSINAGIRDDGETDKSLAGLVTAGSFGYGFKDFTLKSSVLLHSKYVAAGAGVVHSLGDWGTVSAEGVYAYARYDNDSAQSGGKFSVNYAKSFNNGASFQVTGAQYTSRDFVEFSGFTPWDATDINSNKQKNQYEMSLSHRLSDTVGAGISAWHRIYWGDEESSTGANINLSSSFKHLSLSLGGSYSKSGDDEDYGLSLSGSLPFESFGQKFSSYTNVSINKYGDQGYTAGISSSLGEKMSYSASMGWNSGSSDKSYSLQTSYQGDRALVNAQMSSSSGKLTGSASVSGSAIVLPGQRDLILTRNVSDTIAIANVKDTPGVEFTSSPYPTNNKGNAVIPLTAYDLNRVTLSGSTLPIDTELLTTEQTVVPSSGAVVFLPFDAVKVKRYLFQIKQKNGEFIPNGTWATSSTGVPLGFIAQNGILFVNSVDELTGLTLGQCVIKGSAIKNTEKLQEVVCGD
ncbi:PefC/AfrB family outer membrane usher protein [Photobacterium damselae]|uniref:PefC/AfrB family outer membrane usher protein n=1 Tax=Photobacterium damselae TaxID=38293 RepID=UPI004067E07B